MHNAIMFHNAQPRNLSSLFFRIRKIAYGRNIKMYFFPQVRKTDTQENLYLQRFPSPLNGMRQACSNLLPHFYRIRQ